MARQHRLGSHLAFVLAVSMLPRVGGAAAPPDPLAQPFESYAATVSRHLRPVFDRYQKAARPDPARTVLKPPEATLERWLHVGALGALPPDWVAKLNKLGDASQRRGEAEVDSLSSPDEYREYERDYAGSEPAGDPVRTPHELLGGQRLPTAPPTAPPFDQLGTLVGRSGPADQALLRTVAGEVEASFRRLCRFHVAQALGELQRALSPPVVAARPAGPAVETPWQALGSAAVEARVTRYLAERYFKGRWVAGRSRARSTGSGRAAPSEVATQKDRVRSDKGTRWDAGTGAGDGSMKLPSGTGTGSGSVAPAQPVGGTGDGKVRPRD